MPVPRPDLHRRISRSVPLLAGVLALAVVASACVADAPPPPPPPPPEVCDAPVGSTPDAVAVMGACRARVWAISSRSCSKAFPSI